MTEERKQYLREVFRLSPRNWISLLNEGKINAKELQFLSIQWEKMRELKGLKPPTDIEQVAQDFGGEII